MAVAWNGARESQWVQSSFRAIFVAVFILCESLLSATITVSGLFLMICTKRLCVQSRLQHQRFLAVL